MSESSNVHTCSECGHQQPLILEDFLGNFMKAKCEECEHEDLYMTERWQPGDTPEIREQRRKFYEKYERMKQAFWDKYQRYPYSDREFLDFKNNYDEIVK